MKALMTLTMLALMFSIGACKSKDAAMKDDPAPAAEEEAPAPAPEETKAPAGGPLR